MPAAGSPDPVYLRPAAHRSVWLNLAWKLLLVLVIFFLLSVENPLLSALAWTLVNPLPGILLIWGGLVVGIAASNLFAGDRVLRWSWTALSVGVYGALAIPGLVSGPARLVEAIGPVVALTLAAHLARRDLQRALRDWAYVMALALYGSFGVLSMWLVANSFGPDAFLVGVLLPPVVFEAAALLLHRLPGLKDSRLAYLLALLISTALAIVVLSFTLLHSGTPPLWTAIFDVAAGLLIGGALLVGFLTRPLAEAASGAHDPQSGGLNLARALVELSHGPFLISLAVYLPLRVLNLAG